MAKKSLLKLKNVSKFYYNKGMVSSGFTKVNLELNLGEFVVITGESGSGKSTLLNVLSGLDSYEEGEMYINGEETSHYTEEDFEKYRKTYIGNIFQSFNLVNSYTVYQNVELVLLLNGFKKKEVKDKVNELIDKVGLSKYRNAKVSKLSGGQKQRVAIARALAKDTPIILADEPTGNLDSASAKSVLKLLAEIAKEKLVIIVTHNYDQVEEYATRKLEMHDGKLREDIVLKGTKEIEPTIYKFKDLTLGNKIRLGFRNTFNIPIKFILMLIVFLFVCISFLSEYAGLKQVEYNESLSGYNYYFDTSSDKRIIVKKNDKSPISKDDLEKLGNLSHVKRVVENDIILDTEYSIQDNDYYNFWGHFDNIDQIDKVDKGRLPENDYEIVISGYEYDYYLKYESKKILGKEFTIYSSYSASPIPFNHKLTVVGIVFQDETVYGEDKFYMSEKALDELRTSATANYASGNIIINNNKYQCGIYSEYSIVANPNLNEGEAYFSKDMDYLCKNEYCKNTTFTIDIDTIYYNETIDLKVKNSYTKNNYKRLTGRDDFDNIWNVIFISMEDYNKLYDKETFQSSIFVDDEKYIYDTEKTINDMGYTTLVVKDTLTNDAATLMSVLKIVRVVIIVVEFIFLFFISYFVIKLIQKSKNVYYATVRILGGSKKVINSLIRDELLIIFHIAFILVTAFTVLIKVNVIDISILGEYAKYLELKDFISIYVILLLMSLLIANRYSRKLFKSSAMKVYREEV